MVIDLRQLYENLGKSVDFNYEIGKDSVEGYNQVVFSKPVTVKGNITNRSGMIELKLTADYGLGHVCDRCLLEFERDYSFDMDVMVVSSAKDYSDGYIEVSGDKLNLDEHVLSTLLLHFPSKVLCRDDCKGLCQKCGADLNEGDCGCQV